MFAEQLSVLLLFDGDPVFQAIRDGAWERTLNTPFALVRDTRSRVCSSPAGAVTATTIRSAHGRRRRRRPRIYWRTCRRTASGARTKVKPRIVVATRPTELI